MSKGAGKVGTDGGEALRAGVSWTPMLGVFLYFNKRKEENGDD
jgi:hypothetical protein